MTRLAPVSLVAAALSLVLAGPVHAQTGRVQSPGVAILQTPTELDQRGAEETRRELERIMRLYPPALGRVLKLDPTLMSNPAYLAPYPVLTTFIQRHPEIPRYSSYFLSFVDGPTSYEFRQNSDPEVQRRQQAFGMWRDVFQGLIIFSGFGLAIFTITWLIRYIVGHRRWLRATKIQSEVHGRLMERFSANDELLAYVQSPAGQKFLQAAPIAVDAGSAPDVAAPFGRILWSVQAGLVLGCAGVGLLVIKPYVIEEVAQTLLVLGVLGLSIGIGFALAAGASYVLSERLGLLDSVRTSGTTGKD